MECTVDAKTKTQHPNPASRLDDGRRDASQRSHSKLGQAFASLNAVLKIHLRRSADGRKVVSHATIADRSEFYSRMLRELHALGYRLLDIHQLKPKHVDALMKHWEAAGLSASTLQKRFSHIKVLCGWIKKASMLGSGASTLDDPARYQRHYAADHDHSWTAQGVDPHEKIAEIAADDADVARVLRLQYAFGLRLQEASLLNPVRDMLDRETLRVVSGTKGGRPRVVPIETEAQRALLAEARRHAEGTGRSMIPPHYDLKHWLTRCYTVLTRHGVTRKNGLVTHGLRHQYANDRYEELTGEPSPVRGGRALEASEDQAARLEVTARLGHARPQITNAYYGREPITATTPHVSAEERRHQARELSVQKRLLSARLKERIGSTTRRGLETVSASTQALRLRMLHRMLADLMRLGVPLTTPDQLAPSQVDALLGYWRGARLTVESVRQRVQLLTQLCEWLEQPDLARYVRDAARTDPANPSNPSDPSDPSTPSSRSVCPWSAAQIQESLQAIRTVDARVALHLDLVLAFGLTHRQAGALQPEASQHAGALDVLWEVPREQVLRFPVHTARQQAVLEAARRVLPDPTETVCPSAWTLETWLRRVYDVMRTVGGIGIPGAPSLRELQDPSIPAPLVLSREEWMLERTGLQRPRQARRR